jgi:hypothetical protein
MYAVKLGWFRVTHKKLYAFICVGYVWAVLAMHPSLASAWAKYPSCFLFGNSGCDIAWNQANEFMNSEVKSMGQKDASSVNSTIITLNGLNSADVGLHGSLATERMAPGEYTEEKAAHVDKSVEVLKEVLWTDPLDAPRKKLSPFGGGGKLWLKVNNHTGCPNATTSKFQGEMAAWVTNVLKRASFQA